MKRNSSETIIYAAKNCIEIEYAVIGQLLHSLDEAFVSAVQKVFSCNGRLVVTGIGKSAIIGQKIVATLNSTGTPALFMHAADAIHGDLGMLQETDIVLCISKSGETPEIRVLIPLIKSRRIQLIGMCAQKDSYLSKQSDYLLYTPVVKEAEPNNLAPTASTTAQIVMGDAFAVSLLALRGFGPEDFAKFHPGGSLGKQLYLKVDDFYQLHGRPTVSMETTLKDILITISSSRLGATAVLDEQERLIGIITDGDIRRFFQKEFDLNGVCAKNLVQTNCKTIQIGEMAVRAVQMMQENSISQLIVMDEDKYLGMIHVHDLLKEGII